MRQRCSVLLYSYCLGASFVLPQLAKQVTMIQALDRISLELADMKASAAVRGSLLQARLEEVRENCVLFILKVLPCPILVNSRHPCHASQLLTDTMVPLMYDTSVVAGRITASNCRVSSFLYHSREMLCRTYSTDKALPGLILSSVLSLLLFSTCPPPPILCSSSR